MYWHSLLVIISNVFQIEYNHNWREMYRDLLWDQCSLPSGRGGYCPGARSKVKSPHIAYKACKTFLCPPFVCAVQCQSDMEGCKVPRGVHLKHQSLDPGAGRMVPQWRGAVLQPSVWVWGSQRGGHGPVGPELDHRAWPDAGHCGPCGHWRCVSVCVLSMVRCIFVCLTEGGVGWGGLGDLHYKYLGGIWIVTLVL